MRRHRAPLVVVILLAALGTSGCIQWGEYAMGSECESFSQEVEEAVDAAYGDAPQIDRMWAGEAEVWCSFDVLTGQDLAVDDQTRVDLRSTLQALLEETFSSGVEVTVVYAADQDFILLDTRESVARAECTTISQQVESLVVELYGDEAYVFTVRAPAASPGDAECSFDVLTQQDMPAGEPARLEASRAVQAVLPPDVEANLVYADGRDRVLDSGVTTELAPSDP